MAFSSADRNISFKQDFCSHINNIKSDVNLLNPGMRVLIVKKYISFIRLGGGRCGQMELLLQGTTL
jgi:hypothetical protein